MRLASLPPLLRDEPALTAVGGRANAVLAVPESARALVLAGISYRTGHRPLVIVTPTGTTAAASSSIRRSTTTTR